MLKHFELVKCPLCSSFCCVLLIFLYGIKGCFLSKIYSLNILLNQHPTRLSFTPYTATTTRTILISLKTLKNYKIYSRYLLHLSISICLLYLFLITLELDFLITLPRQNIALIRQNILLCI